MLLTAKINFNNIALSYMWLSAGLIYIYQECISLDDYMRLPNNFNTRRRQLRQANAKQ
jgi:hypothetical protein